MKKHLFSSPLRSLLSLALLGVLCLGASSSALAQGNNQNRTGGFGGFGGFGGMGGTGTSSSSSNSTTTARQYQNSTLMGEATITCDPDTRRLIVVTDDETNENIKAIISQLDKPKPQVLINVVFLQVTLNDDLDVGASAKFTNQDASGIAQTIFGSPTTGGTYTMAYKHLDATISALSTLGRTEILSRPSILARSSQQAKIVVGQQVPFITNSRVDATSGSTINTVSYQDIGIILRVTPFITSEGMVEMIVSPEISSLSEKTVAISDTATTPIIDTRSADTVVVTPSDKTVVIGGLISRQTTDQDSKVPILGDIPLIGAAFKRKIKSSQRTELLIFMTPHVVQSPEDLSRLSASEQTKLELESKTFDQKDTGKLDIPTTSAPKATK